MAKNDRFQIVQQQGNGITSPQYTVLMDTATGVQYLFVQSGNGAGLCPLVNQEGGPLVWNV